MSDEYTEIKVPLGSTVKDAVEKLLTYQHESYAKLLFNGVWLYSDTVTLDSAYLEVTGLTYDEYLLRTGGESMGED